MHGSDKYSPHSHLASLTKWSSVHFQTQWLWVRVQLQLLMPNEIPVVFHYGSNYDYHFIIKEIAKNQFEGKIECLGENTEKYKTFSVLIKREVTKIDKDGNESVLIISYKTKLIDSTRFMATALSNLVDNLARGISKITC